RPSWLPDRLRDATKELASAELHPTQPKRLLARTVVDLYHGDGAGAAAEAEFDRGFKDHAVPADVPDKDLTDAGAQLLSRWLLAAELVTSNRAAKREVEAGSVKID